jgi:hypothetical protein
VLRPFVEFWRRGVVQMGEEGCEGDTETQVDIPVGFSWGGPGMRATREYWNVHSDSTGEFAA